MGELDPPVEDFDHVAPPKHPSDADPGGGWPWGMPVGRTCLHACLSFHPGLRPAANQRLMHLRHVTRAPMCLCGRMGTIPAPLVLPCIDVHSIRGARALCFEAGMERSGMHIH